MYIRNTFPWEVNSSACNCGNISQSISYLGSGIELLGLDAGLLEAGLFSPADFLADAGLPVPDESGLPLVGTARLSKKHCIHAYTCSVYQYIMLNLEQLSSIAYLYSEVWEITLTSYLYERLDRVRG